MTEKADFVLNDSHFSSHLISKFMHLLNPGHTMFFYEFQNDPIRTGQYSYEFHISFCLISLLLEFK